MANKKKKKGIGSAGVQYVNEQKPKTVYSGSGIASGLRSSSAEKSTNYQSSNGIGATGTSTVKETATQRAERKRSNQMRTSPLVSVAKTMSKNSATTYKTTLPSIASRAVTRSKAQAPKTSVSSSIASRATSSAKAQAPKTKVSSSMTSRAKEQTKVQAPKSRVVNTIAKNALAPVNKYAESHMVTGGHGVGTYGFKTSVRQKALAPAKEIAEYTKKQRTKYAATPSMDVLPAEQRKTKINTEYGNKLRAGMPSTNTAIMSWRSDPTKEELKYRDRYGFTDRMNEALDRRLNENMLEASYSPTTGKITEAKNGRAISAGFTDAFARENPEDTVRRQYGIDLDENTQKQIEAQRNSFNYGAGMAAGQMVQYAATRGLLGTAGLVGKSAEAISDTNKVVRVLENRGVKTGTAKAITALMEEMGIDQAASVPLNLVDAMKADGGANIIKRFGINQGLDVLFSGLFEIPTLRRNLHFLNGNEMNEAANAMQEGTEKLSMKIGAKGHLDTAVDETGDVARQEAVQISMFNDNGEIAVGRMPEQPRVEQPVVETPRAEVPQEPVATPAARATVEEPKVEVQQEKVETPKAKTTTENQSVDIKRLGAKRTKNVVKQKEDALAHMNHGETRKASFYVNAGNVNGEPTFKMVDGMFVRENDNLFGVHKSGKNKWFATDVETGLPVASGRTRKEVMEAIDNGASSNLTDAGRKRAVDEFNTFIDDAIRSDDEQFNEIARSYNKMSDEELNSEKNKLLSDKKNAGEYAWQYDERVNIIDDVLNERNASRTAQTPKAEPKAKASNSASDEEIDRLVREQTKEMYDKMSTDELQAELRWLGKNPTVTPDVEGAAEMGIKEAMDSDEVAQRTDIINEILNERRANGSVKPNVDRSREEVFVSEEQVDKVFNDAIRKRSYRFETLRAYPRSGDMRIIIGDRAYDERGFRRLIREDLERTKAQVNEAINARAAKLGKQKASVEEPKAETKPAKKAEQKAEPSSAWDEIENEVDNIPTKEPPNKLKSTKSAEKVPDGVERLDSETQEAIEKSKRMTQKEKEASKKSGDYKGGMPKEMEGQPLNKGFDSITRKDADTSDAAVLDIMESVTMGGEGRKVSRGVKEMQEEAAARWENDTATSLKKITVATEGLKDGTIPKGYDTFQEYFADVKEGMKYYQKLQKEAGEGTDAYWKAVENEADIARGAAKVTSNMGAGFRQYQEILGASPKARVIIVQKEIKKIEKQFEKLLNGKEIKPLSPEVTKMLEEAKTPVQQAEALEQASIEIWSQIPASVKEKADQWRMTSMLLNPKTHLRNIIGNFLFRPAILIKDALSATAEKALVKAGKIDPEDATKAFINRLSAKDRSYRDAAKKVWEEYQTIIRRSGGKYFDTVDSKGFLTSRPLEVGRFTAGKEDPNAVQRALDFLAKKNGDALEAEDAFFMRGKFVDSYAKILKARKLDPAKMTEEQLQSAIDDAAQEALRSTYRDASGLANAINKARNYKPDASAGKKLVGWAVDATLPFVKTPVNILRRAKDYSPVGFIEGAANLTKALSKGDSKAAAEALDRVASGLTGGGICALGLFLGQMGLLDSKLEDGSEGFYKQDLGYQNYSLKLGGDDGVSISLSWAAPLSIPLFTGVEYAKMRENGLSLKDWVKFVDVAGRIFDPTMEMSVMQGPMALLEAISDGENGGDKILKGGLSVGLNYVGQYYPTISGQVARTVDPVRRNTSSTADSTTGRSLEKWKNKQIAKTPFLSKTQEPYVNVWGEEQKTTDNVLLRAAYEFGSPAYVNKIKADEVDKEIIRLNKAAASDEDKIIPSKYFSNAVSFDGGKVSLDAKDLTMYNKIKGKASKEAIRKLIKTDEYKNANNDGKRELINNVMKNASTEAKQKTLISKGKDEWKVYTEGFTGGWEEQADAAKDAGIKAEQYYKIKTDKSVDLDENGGKSQYEVYTYLEGTDLTKSQKSALWNAYNKGWKNNPYAGGDIPEAPDPDDVELAAAKKEAKTLSKAKARAEGSLAAKAFEKSVLKRATETASLLEDSGSGSSKGSSRRGRSGRRGGGGSGSSKRKQTASERKFANGIGKLSSVDLEKIYKQTQGKQTKLPTVDLIKIYEQAKIKPAKVPTTSLVKAYTQVQQASKTKTPTPMDIKVKGLTKSQKKAMLKVMLKKLDTKR